MDLLHEIARCTNVTHCLNTAASQHPCSEIVHAQAPVDAEDYQLPEPWTSNLVTAPILFISSNPSIDLDECYPLGSWSDARIADFFSYRLGGGDEAWTKDERYPLLRDGTYRKRAVRFWSSIRGRAAELLRKAAHEVRPGIDFAMSEVVHCKSRSEIGVAGAVDECARRYLRRVIEQSGSSIVVCLGAFARNAVARHLKVPGNGTNQRVAKLCGLGQHDRYITWLPHPAAFAPKTFQACLSRDELTTLQVWLSGRTA